MEENLSGNRARTSSRASSSFFIEDILGNRGGGQEAQSSGGGWMPAGGSDPDRGSCAALRSPFREPPVHWHRSATELHSAALETSESE